MMIWSEGKQSFYLLLQNKNPPSPKVEIFIKMGGGFLFSYFSSNFLASICRREIMFFLELKCHKKYFCNPQMKFCSQKTLKIKHYRADLTSTCHQIFHLQVSDFFRQLSTAILQKNGGGFLFSYDLKSEKSS